MEDFIKNQILSGVKIAPINLLKSYFIKQTNPAVEAAKRKLGGKFLKGVCHPSENFEQIKGAGIQYFRPDAPVPFDADGNLREDYKNFKAKLQRYADNGIKAFVVTPYHSSFRELGIECRTPEGEAKICEAARFYVQDLRDVAIGFQVTNEQGVPRFTNPLSMKEAAHYIGVQLQAMYPLRGDLLIGYNSGGPQCDLHELMKPWHQYCDYIGIDVYIGCFTPVGNWMYLFDACLRFLYAYTGKPILLTEFGYISGGAPKTAEEKKAVLQRYGVSSEAEARADIKAFVEKLPERIRNQVYNNASGDWGDFLFQIDFCYHFYSELPKKVVIKKYPHTPEGQAGFYTAIWPRLKKLPFLLGAFVYCWGDSHRCYVCGQEDCPTETRWGLTTVDGKEKPSYYAVQEALAKID
ncbi:MAG: hypothetical protein LBR73_03180 [Oscillospiraceae bacterium]|jgi:hypothetical protein|nr:hypothetical protein [Oscillospiraceae bacterium]